MNKEILKEISYGMYVVTAKSDKNVGCIINTLSQITSDNPIISISLNKKNYTNEVIKKTGKFAISILSEKTNPKVIGTFGFSSSRDTNKFAEIDYENIDNLHIIKEETCGYLLCEVINTIDVETHDIFLARIIAGEKTSENKPMTYKYYQEVIKGSSPSTAPTYIPKEAPHESQNVYVCDLCGYEYSCDGELPEDFVCPLCGATKEQFSKK